MRKRIRVWCLIWGAGLVLGGCVNREAPQAPPTQDVPQESIGSSAPEPDMLHVAVNSADSLNPYTSATRMNQDLQYLIYDAPVKLDAAFQPHNDLAESVDMTGEVCTVRLRSGVRFSNGMPLTSRDAAYSLNLLRQKDLRYANVASVDTPDDSTLRITLARPDIWFPSLLTFPVIREGSGGEATPPGTGRFIPRGGRLLANQSHYSGAQKIKTIELVQVTSSREVGYLLMSGKIDLALLEPEASPFETAGSFPVQTNEMLFIGFNGESAPGNNALLRRAVSLLLDRTEIAREVYGGRAVTAAHPINPAFYPETPPETDMAEAAALLEQMGMDKLSADERWRLLDGREASLDLLVNMEAEDKRETARRLKEQIERGKIHVNVIEVPYDEYRAQVSGGDYHMYLGQVKLPEDMNVSMLLSGSGALHYRLGNTDALYGAYLSARQGQSEFSAFFSSFDEQTPFVPVLFPQEIVAHTRNFNFSVIATAQDIFYNINQW